MLEENVIGFSLYLNCDLIELSNCEYETYMSSTIDIAITGSFRRLSICSEFDSNQYLEKDSFARTE